MSSRKKGTTQELADLISAILMEGQGSCPFTRVAFTRQKLMERVRSAGFMISAASFARVMTICEADEHVYREDTPGDNGKLSEKWCWLSDDNVREWKELLDKHRLREKARSLLLQHGIRATNRGGRLQVASSEIEKLITVLHNAAVTRKLAVELCKGALAELRLDQDRRRPTNEKRKEEGF
jgi:hypothetical protein